MKHQETLLADVHRELLELLAGEDQSLKNPNDDTLALAKRLCQLAAAGKVDGFGLVELDQRSRLLCSLADMNVKGRAQRVARLVECFARALAAAMRAVKE